MLKGLRQLVSTSEQKEDGKMDQQKIENRDHHLKETNKKRLPTRRKARSTPIQFLNDKYKTYLNDRIDFDPSQGQLFKVYEPKRPLTTYQRQLFELLMARSDLLIADESGLGKTPPLLCSHDVKIKLKRVQLGLYLTKACFVRDVKRQAEMFTDLQVLAIDGSSTERAELYQRIDNKSTDLVILSYESYVSDSNHLLKIGFEVCYLDEVHEIKNQDSEIARLLLSLDIKERYAISATPIIHTPSDLLNVLQWLRKDTSTCFQNQRLIDEKQFRKILRETMVRRLKTDVANEWPSIRVNHYYCECTTYQHDLYDQVKNATPKEVFLGYAFSCIPNAMAKYLRLSQITESMEIVSEIKGTLGSSKLVALEEMIETIVAQKKKVVVFSQSTRFVELLVEFFEKYNPASLHSETTDVQKELDKFSNDQTCWVLFCAESLRKDSWTVSVSDHVIFTSKPWSKESVARCIRRVRGKDQIAPYQTNVYTLICKDTIDETIEQVLGEEQYHIQQSSKQHTVHQIHDFVRKLTELEKKQRSIHCVD